MTRRRNQSDQPDQAAVEPDPDTAAREWLAAVFRRQADNVPDDDATPVSMNALIRRATGRPDAA